MAMHTQPPTTEGLPPPPPPAPVDPHPSPFYDRSSLDGDYMVMLAGQTEADFYRLAPENRFCEYIDGVVYMPSPVGEWHQDRAVFLTALLAYLRGTLGYGLVRTGPAVLRLAPDRSPEPDIFVLPADAARPDEGARPAALLVIEILSPSTRSHDLGLKSRIYQEAGIPEIWYVDDRDRVLIADRKVGDRYERERLGEGVCRSSALPGFWIDVAWFWASPLPDPRQCLETILAGPPA